MVKKFLFIVMLVMVLTFAVSCGPMGGTIIIDNEAGSPAWSVAIGSSSTRLESDTVTLYSGQKHEKSFLFDGKYYAFGYFTSGWRTIKVSLSGGETVIIKGSDFFD